MKVLILSLVFTMVFSAPKSYGNRMTSYYYGSSASEEVPDDEECTAAILWAGEPLECSSFMPLGNRLLLVKIVTTWNCASPPSNCICHRYEGYRPCHIQDKGYSVLVVWGDVHRFVSQRFEDPPFGGLIHEYEYPGEYFACLSIFKLGVFIGTTVCEYVTVTD